MSRIISAFNLVLKLQSRSMKLKDLDNSVEIDVKAAPSNYFRNIATVEDTITQGREFVISKNDLNATIPEIKRGMRLVDINGDFETSIVKEIREMIILGSVVGYRVRTD